MCLQVEKAIRPYHVPKCEIQQHPHYPHIHSITSTHSNISSTTNLALQAKLGLTVRSHSAPSRLIRRFSIVTNGRRLPRLVKRLKVESVEAPVKERAKSVLVKVLCVVETALGVFVVGADGCGPAGFAVPDLGLLVRAASDFFDVRDGLVHVVEVHMLKETLV
jgi:hypothetical protein